MTETDLAFSIAAVRRRLDAVERRLKDGAESPDGLAGIAREIRQTAEEVHRGQVDLSRRQQIAEPAANEAMLEAILASTLDPIVTIDRFGTILTASDAIERVFGWTPRELEGKNVTVLMPDPHRSRHDGYLERYRRTGVTTILGHAREFEAVHKSGRRVPVEVSVSRVEIPGRAEPLLTGIIRDISERQQAEAALAESERRLREMLRGVELLAVSLDLDGAITFCNDYLLWVTGWTRDDVLGANWFERFVPPDRSGAIAQEFRTAVRAGRIRSHFEGDIVTKSGARRVIAWNNTILRDPAGTIIGTTGLGVDVTVQRLNEGELARYRDHLENLVADRTRALEESHEQLRLTDRLASIGTLVAGLGHDMNNVLFPVRSRLDVLDTMALPPRARKNLSAVRESVNYLQQLTDGLHLLALDPNDPNVAPGSTDVVAWWGRARALLRRAIPGHALFESDLPADLPAVRVAPHRLTQAVLNLVINAGEVVSADGHICLWGRSGEDGEIVELGVTDDGPGMSPEIKRRALEPFFTTKRRGLGTGLGLSLVHGVAKSAGGTVRIESEPGRGTTVVMALPAVGALDWDGAGPHGAAVGPAVVSVSDPRIASLITTILRSAGVETTGGEPESSRLWIADPAALDAERVRRFLGTGHRRLVVCGPGATEWKMTGAITVEDPGNFEVIRERIGRALAASSKEEP